MFGERGLFQQRKVASEGFFSFFFFFLERNEGCARPQCHFPSTFKISNESRRGVESPCPKQIMRKWRELGAWDNNLEQLSLQWVKFLIFGSAPSSLIKMKDPPQPKAQSKQTREKQCGGEDGNTVNVTPRGNSVSSRAAEHVYAERNKQVYADSA